MNSNLLITKIIPPTRRQDALRRHRLLEFLHEYIGRKLVLISAFAGYGKTSLLADFCTDTLLAVCWYTVSATDQDLQVFVDYLVAALQRRFPQFGTRTTALLRNPAGKPSADAYVGALVTDIQEQIDEFFVLVIDDYHLVEDSEPINQLIDRLLYFLPENAHIILSSRTVPARLTLTRLTAQMQVAGLGTNDLRFTANEIRALAQQNFAIEITPTIADELARHSEGWITGIVLTTPTMWRGLFHEWVKKHGPGGQLFDYLAVEVFQQQSHELRQFLLETSILAEMDVALCNELFGRDDTDALLELAEARNLFVTRLGDQGFRYHHLLREFLQQRLKQTQPERYYDLQRQAASLFERKGKLEQAIEYYLAARDPREAARLIDIVQGGYYEAGRWTTLTRWLDALPEAVLRESPDMLLQRAYLDAETGAPESARRLLEVAIAEFEARGDYSNAARALIQSARHEAKLAPALERCERALALMQPGEYLLHAAAYRTIGSLKGLHGDYAGAIPLLERAVTLYEVTNERYQRADAEMPLGIALLVVGEWDRAMEHFESARTYWQRMGNSAKLANTLNSIAVARYERGELGPATELLLEALEHARLAGNLRTEGYILTSLGDIYRDLRNHQDAVQAYTDAAVCADKIREPLLATFARVGVGDVWRLAGDLETSEQVLEATLQTATSQGSEFQVALAQVALSGLRLSQQQPDAATRLLEHALPVLERTQSSRDVGRARFNLAHAALLQGKRKAALQHLRTLAQLGATLGETQFLMSQAANARRVLDYALAHRSGVAYYRELANKLGAAPRTSPAPIAVPQAGLPELELYTFGEARVMMDGELISASEWQTATTKELFFFFATNPQGWRKEQILEELWPDASRNQGNDLFHASMYRLRRALFPEAILFRDGVYRLNPEAVRWLDAQEFEQERTTAMQLSDAHAQIELLERVVALYRGDFLSEFYGDWCMLRREELRTHFLDALARLGRAWQGAGNYKRAEQVYLKTLERDPAREETYRDLMSLYASTGSRADIIQTYRQCVEHLQTEVGVAPLPETVELYRRLLSD